MPRRTAASPAPSDAELDILDSLYPLEEGAGPAAVPGQELDLDDILNVGAADDDDDDDETFIGLRQAASYRKASNLKGRTVKKGGGFQAMGLNGNLLKAIARKGFSVPTPIQRKTIPLVLERKDVVGMARTGSGKTAAFVIPMIERLRAHSARFGSRAIILSPSRELAIQTLKVVKEFSKGTDLKSVLLVGGDSLEEQFASVAANPDIVIATPGRFLHLKVEMSLNLSSVQYVVFDEADRLFEMGFAAQLTEILHALPPSRQTLLFSATLPASLVEFARAGLQDPSLVRLDAETKVSPDLENAFFSVKGNEKEGTLLHLLHDVMGIPVGDPAAAAAAAEGKPSKKRKRGSDAPGGKPTEHSTIIFASTKHHVEYLAGLLRHAGFAVSHVYGSLDQTARRIQVDDFRRGKTHILVVTDVAARGVDIPVLANVINYDFPPQPKIFVHRVGRTARAGQRGWSYSLVRDIDAPYLLDLQLFLGKRLMVGEEGGHTSFSDDVVVGAARRDSVEPHVEWMNKALDESDDIDALRRVAGKAEKLYMKTRNSASSQSAKRARALVASSAWTQTHRLFGGQSNEDQQARAAMLAKISGFKPAETIFEVGHADRSTSEAAGVMKQLRKRFKPRNRQSNKDNDESDPHQSSHNLDDMVKDEKEDEKDEKGEEEEEEEGEEEEEQEEEVTISNGKRAKINRGRTDWRDGEAFMSYTPRTTSAAESRGYGVHSGGSSSTFVEAARAATMELTNDETAKSFGVPARQRMRWDVKAKKYVSRDNDEDGSKGGRLVMGESGVKIAASFQSGRFDRWRRAQRMSRLPHVGEAEKPSSSSYGAEKDRRFRHRQMKAPREADHFRDDFFKQKKRVAAAREQRIDRFGDGVGTNHREIKAKDDVRKAREEKKKRLAKNARPPKKKRKN
ncbi:hypothetical protein L249_8051 [Ophiocordyceps polyrhachis-furcata BCC 54312]|uniref:RNA helicase n=1 Tax=Ophiocordyceps polyrhachis-furcata BCC 54312 TaxID=1330021 RepID=A0A367LHY8_9HYPO|nr:hypothetical protein L249_8051 [Ophiocordyceps polyrhachis-furcata BCC 54312]